MIESLRLENFKNFRDATLNLGPLTVLVGANASGKSNLRDAFRFLHGMGRGYSLAEIIGEKYGEGGERLWKGIRGGISEIAFYGSHKFSMTTVLRIPNIYERTGSTRPDIWDAKHRIEILLEGKPLSPYIHFERLVSGTGIVFNYQWDPKLPNDLNKISVRAYDQQVKGGYIEFLSSKPVLLQYAHYYDISKVPRRPAMCFSEELQSMRFFDLSSEAMKIPSLPGQIILGDHGENLSSVLLAICEDKRNKQVISEWIRQLTPLDVVDFEFIPDQTGRVLVNLIEANGQRTSAYSASDGTLRFLAMIAAMLGSDPAKFYFFEELDTGIHPTRLYLLLQLIEQQAKAGKVQVVATTHSPQLLAMLSKESLEHASLVYRLEGSSEAHIKRIVDIPDARRLIKKQGVSRLHESGWLEDAVSFTESAESAR